MGVSIPVLVITISLHLIAFVLAVGAERRRSKAIVEPDEYDEKTYCMYGTDASTVYGLTAFGLLLMSQALVNAVTKCLCFGRGMMITAQGMMITARLLVLCSSFFLGNVLFYF